MQWTIGIREAKSRLSELLRDIKHGQEWTITDRGIPIAKIVPMPLNPESLDQRIAKLEQRGLLSPRKKDFRQLPPPLRLEAGLAQQYLDEDRSH